MNCIYTINNIHTQEVLYVGSCKKLSKRITNHKYESKKEINRKLYKYINYYGWNNFEFNIVCENIVIPEGNVNIMRLIEEQYRKLLKPKLNSFICIIEDKKAYLKKPTKCKYCDCFIQRWNMPKHVKYHCKKIHTPIIDDELEKNHYVDEIKSQEIVDIP